MAKKIIVANQKRGCLWLCGALILVCLVIALLAYAACIAAGVGLWFLLRYIWRRLVIEAPGSGVVRAGQKLPPIGRKVLAGVACAFVALALMSALGSADQSSTTAETQQASEQQELTAPDEEPNDDTAANEEEPETAIALDDMTVTFIDVGQGDAALIELPDGNFMLIDAGEASASQAVLQALDDAGVEQLDYLVATHPHSDHIGGMEAVLGACEVEEVWMPDAPATTATYEDFLDAVDAEGSTVNLAEKGATIVAGDAGYEVDVLAPTDDVESDDMNDYSAIVRVTYGATVFLFTGDASSSEIVAANPGDVDVLKAAHHGSETGTDGSVMSATTPEHVVMSYAEGNSYGHPDQSALDAISAAGATAYSTAANGNVTAVSDGEGVTVTTERDGEIVAGMTTEEREAAEAAARAEEEARAQAEAEAAAQAEAEAQAQAEAERQQDMVVVTQTGKKYHRPGCRTLSNSKNTSTVTRSEAEAMGLGPCGVCHP